MRLATLFLIGMVCAACDRKPVATVQAEEKIWEDFSGENALRHVQQLVDLGPRPPGSDALEKARGYIAKELEAAGWRVTRQSFSNQTPRGSVTFVNLVATFPAEGNAAAVPVFLLCSHYDTKFYELQQFVGANDGGSSNGVLLEMARVLTQRPALASKTQLVFFDGEEAYVDFTQTDGLYGSRYFAQQLVSEGKARQFRAGILFDMVGDRSLTITLPPDSPPALVEGIFASAEALNVRKHFTYSLVDIIDDHTPLNAIGIPTIDLIDFDYAVWHTPEDTMDKISAESLEIVGSVALHYLSGALR